jgi:uncharacterized Zn-finger protein
MREETLKSPDKRIVHQGETSCDGGLGPLGHPKIYLKIDLKTKSVTCPYCSRQFIYVDENTSILDAHGDSSTPAAEQPSSTVGSHHRPNKTQSS